MEEREKPPVIGISACRSEEGIPRSIESVRNIY